MIKVKTKVNEVIISGHANFDNYGKDIVCASVSSLVTAVVNNIFSINKEALVFNDDGNKITIEVNNDELCLKLLHNLVDMLNDLAKSYPKNIKVESEE